MVPKLKDLSATINISILAESIILNKQRLLLC